MTIADIGSGDGAMTIVLGLSSHQRSDGRGFTHVRTIDAWPPGDKRPTLHLALFRK